MHNRLIAVAVLVLSSQTVSAQDVARYGAYALESSVDAVVLDSGSRSSDIRVLHERRDRAGSSLTLLRGVYSSEFQLLLTSKTLSTRARSAIREPGRLDTADATPREKIRAANRAAFRP
jgi:hypothetical protein